MATVYRKLSSHGSISIPVAMRREMGIAAKDAMEVTVNSKNEIVVRPYVLRCNFCGTQEGVKPYHGKGICKSCGQAILKRLEGGSNAGDRE